MVQRGRERVLEGFGASSCSDRAPALQHAGPGLSEELLRQWAMARPRTAPNGTNFVRKNVARSVAFGLQRRKELLGAAQEREERKRRGHVPLPNIPEDGFPNSVQGPRSGHGQRELGADLEPPLHTRAATIVYNTHSHILAHTLAKTLLYTH